jgi:hypothetical protein
LSASVLTITSAPSFSAGVDARPGRRGEALVVGQADDVVDAVRARDLDRRVGRAVVDDQPLDGVEAGQLARQVGERRGSCAASLKQGIWMISFIVCGAVRVPSTRKLAAQYPRARAAARGEAAARCVHGCSDA